MPVPGKAPSYRVHRGKSYGTDARPIAMCEPLAMRDTRQNTPFSQAERAYLTTQRLARLATVDSQGQPQANPVGFFPQDDGTVLIGGFALGRTKKWRNLKGNPLLALVVDDLVSESPWQVRGVEIRGEAELLTGGRALGRQFGEEVIRVHPRWIRSWGLEDD
ncbi:PPOX class F420-dependent oxidoreductase [Streptomyces sparsus]